MDKQTQARVLLAFAEATDKLMAKKPARVSGAAAAQRPSRDRIAAALSDAADLLDAAEADDEE